MANIRCFTHVDSPLPVRAKSIYLRYLRLIFAWLVSESAAHDRCDFPEIEAALSAGCGSKFRRCQIRRPFEEVEAAGLVQHHFV
jgi:hypothetical protein